MASLDDIAKALGVSVSLVSKVLNNRLGTTGVRADLVERIKQKAVELNYHKNLSAVALLQGRHNVIGTFIHHFGKLGSNVTEELLQGISSAATRQHQRLLLDYFVSAQDFLSSRDFMNAAILDGMIVGGLFHEELREALLEIHRSGLPVVTIHDQVLHPEIPNIMQAEDEIGQMATRHLIEQGCRRIAHIVDFKRRTSGYRKALTEAGLSIDPLLIYDDNQTLFSYEKGERAAQAWLDSGVELDGVFAQSDEEAMGVINVFRAAGLKIPKQVRVIGVDNAPYCAFGPIPISSISQNGVARGREAVRVLMAMINKQPVKARAVKPILVARKSTA